MSLVEIEDKQIGQNLARLRGAMSQKDLAVAMRKRGHKWAQATVWNVERGERPLRLSEATAIADVLGLQSVQSITAPEGEFEYLVTEAKLYAAKRELALRAEDVIRLQRQMVEELNALSTKDLDESTVRSLEWDLRTTPAEIAYDVVLEQFPLVKALADHGGPFGPALLTGFEQLELKTANDITFGRAGDGEHPTAP